MAPIPGRQKDNYMSQLTENSQRKNKCIILNAIHEHMSISRIELSRVTNLNKATVSKIIKDFLDKGILIETGEQTSSNGRSAKCLSLRMESFSVIVIRIQRNHLRSGVYNMNRNLENVRRERYANSLDIWDIIDQIKEEINLQIEYCISHKKEILGISIGTLGFMFVKNEIYHMKVDSFQTLSDADVCNELRKSFPDYKVLMNHDANLGALAEWDYYRVENKRTPSSMLSIVGGIGLGGGIIIDGQVYQGFHGSAGEIGHLGINCLFPSKGINADINFNRSIYEEYASPHSIIKAVHENLYDHPKTVLTLDSSLKDIYEAYEYGDPLAEWAINRMARYFAYGLSGLIFVLDPEVIVLGDEISQSDQFIRILNKFLNDFLPKELTEDKNIRFSKYTEDSILIGAGIFLIKDALKSNDIINSINHYVSVNKKE